MSNYNLSFKKEKHTFDWNKLPISKKIRIMFKKQHYSKDEFSNDYRGIYAVYLDNVMYVNDRSFPQIGFSNCWEIINKKVGSFILFQVGFNNYKDCKQIYITILNFYLWCRW